MEIILYGNGCPRCDILKKKLDEKGVPYTENCCVDEMLRKGITQVPVIELDGKRMNYNEVISWIKEQTL